MLGFLTKSLAVFLIPLAAFSADVEVKSSKFNSFAYIFLMPGYDAEHNTTYMENNGYRFKAVGVDIGNKEEAVRVAKRLALEGYQMIELCGGFGPEWIHRITVELENKVPVGGVFYGPQFRQQLADLFKS